MQYPKAGKGKLSVLEAVDTLSRLAELEGRVLKGTEAAYDEKQVRESFRAIHGYLKHLYEGRMGDVETQRGVQAILVLAKEAVQGADRYMQAFKRGTQKSFAEAQEYKELQQFYSSKLVKKLRAVQSSGEGGGQELLHLKDLDVVRQDRAYELFLIRKEDGRPFFNKGLLRHIRLVGEFDESVGSRLGDVKEIQDQEAHLAAKEILHGVRPQIDLFYKEALHHKGEEFVAELHKALMALLLCANPRHLMGDKNCLGYYHDFYVYLRKAMASSGYQHLSATPFNLLDSFSKALVQLSHALCSALFLHRGTHEKVDRLIGTLLKQGRKGFVLEPATRSPLAFWNTMRDEDEQIRAALRQYPNGPLLKTLGVFRGEGALCGFDPLAQENVLGQLFLFSGEALHITCLRIPAPVHQESIDRVAVAEEFCGFLRALRSQMQGQKLLLFNVQDRTSWQERSRCLALEELQKREEFSETLFVATLPKHTEFYLQSGPYEQTHDAEAFFSALKGHIRSAEESGFYFPSSIDRKEIEAFTAEAIGVIHTLFFGGKAQLLRKNRLDFIEIFHLLLTLKLIEKIAPSSVSFTCKDAIDVGAAASAELYSFLRMMNDKSPWREEEMRVLLRMLYAPSLTVRERAIDSARLERMVSALALIAAELEASRSAVVAACAKLFDFRFFEGLNIQEAI